MSIHDLELIAVKRDWVPEWLFAIAKHWMPLAEALCEPLPCAYHSQCHAPATAMVDVPMGDDGRNRLPMCDFHYDIERALRLGR